MRCQQCGAENPERAKFCLDCGTRIVPEEAAPADRAERRQLSVLFCDLVSSTELANRLDPEELRSIVRAYQVASAAVVARFDGHIAQYLGDGLLVYFGYPTAHEDDAQRAVRSGLGILQAIRNLNPELQARHGVQLEVRIGVHTGLVVAGEIGAGLRRENLAIGETPNVAARLQGLASPGAVLVSGATERLIGGYFRTADLGLHELKGIAQPTPVFRVLAETAARSRLDVASATGLTPLTGREAEAALLRERWAAARAGAGHAVWLCGEAGIGKSRLVRDLQDHVAQDPASWMSTCLSSPYYLNTALHPIVDHIERVNLQFDADDDADQRWRKLEGWLVQYGLSLGEAMPLLGGLLSLPADPRYPPPAREAEWQKQRTMELLVQLLLARTREQPVLFVLEDVHWADATTLDLLGTLMRLAPTHRLMILVTYRPEFDPPWPADAAITTLMLGRLGPGPSAAIAAAMAGGLSLPPEVMDQILARTDGNPLFIEELSKMVVESGAAHAPGEPAQPATMLAPLAIPATLHDSLMARLDRLAAVKPVAQAGAALGREFSYGLLHAVAGLGEPALRHGLAQLVQAGFLYQSGEPPESTYVFKHALIQEAAYGAMLRSTRQDYHARIAQTLELQFPDLAERQPELVARHYTEAGHSARALPLWQDAGRRALQRAANVEAIAHLQQALKLLDTQAPDTALQQLELALHNMLAPAYMAIKGWAAPEVEQCCNRAIALATELGDPVTLFGASWGVWTVHFLRCELEVAQTRAAAVLAMAQGAGLPLMQPPARHAAGFTDYTYGRYAAAAGHGQHCRAGLSMEVERALVTAFQFSPSTACLSYLGVSLFLLGDPGYAAVREQAFALGRELDHLPSYAFLLGFQLYVAHTLQDVREVQRLAPELDALARREGYAPWIPVAELYNGWLEARAGQPAGVDRMRRAIAAKSGTRNLYTHDHLLLAEGLAACGDDEGALQAVELALDFWRRNGLALMVPELLRLRGEIQHRRGQTAAAWASLDLAAETARAHGAVMLLLRAELSRHDLMLQGGDAAGGREKLQRALADVPPTMVARELDAARARLGPAVAHESAGCA